MRLSPEGVAAVTRQIDMEAMADRVAEQLGIESELSARSYASLGDGIIDAVTDVLTRLDFEPEP